jgi:hypothetical protein
LTFHVLYVITNFGKAQINQKNQPKKYSMKILVMDDRFVCNAVTIALKLLYPECDVTSISDLTTAKVVIKESFAGRNNTYRLIITGLDRGNGDDGFQLMRYLKNADPKKVKNTTVVLHCTAPTAEIITEATRLGASAVIEKATDDFYGKIRELNIKP